MTSASSRTELLSETSTFGGASLLVLEALAGEFDRRTLTRGEVLIRAGEPSDALYVVLSGRFTVYVEGVSEPVARIAQGELIGEIGFFAGLPRTATVVALRDSTVLRLDRERYMEVVARDPAVRDVIIESLARRLKERQPRPGRASQVAPIRTLTMLPAGQSVVPPPFVELVRRIFGLKSRAVFVAASDVQDHFPTMQLDDAAMTAWLNELEAQADFVVYLADQTLTPWTERCIRQADTVLLVATTGAASELNVTEELVLSLHSPAAQQLVLLHPSRSDVASGTAKWLAARNVSFHHHVALHDTCDVERLHRFLSHKAVGFVAGGGGALGSAHLGVYKAFAEAGAQFDMLGGTSVGAAMMAGFACGADAERIDQGTHAIFVRSRAFRRPTLPRYGLVDHKAFDRALRDEYGDVLIEDLWRPFFAVSTNLSENRVHIHRRGPLWQAVRASGSIPGVLPPFFTPQGDMLVDGAVLDSLPLETMKTLKGGPNVVVSFALGNPKKYAVDYDAIPGPRELAASMFNPFGQKGFPEAPGILQVIMLSMFASRRAAPQLDETDILVSPTLPATAGFLDWSRHTELFCCTYEETSAWLKQRLRDADPAIGAVFGAP
jgi:NTE family protein